MDLFDAVKGSVTTRDAAESYGVSVNRAGMAWYDCAFFTQDKSLRTMGYLLMSIINKSSIGSQTMDAYAAAATASTVTTLSVQLAAMIVAVAPILLIYPFFQRYIVSGMTIGAVKG